MTLVRTHRRRLTPTVVAIFLNVAVLAAISALMSAGVVRTLAARSLRLQVDNLHDNLVLLAQQRQDRLGELEAELAVATQDLASAQADSPKLGSSYELFRQGFALGAETGTRVDSIGFQGEKSMPSVLGNMSLGSYTVALSGHLSDCVAYIRQLESDGQPFLATEGITLEDTDGTCSFNVTVLVTESSGLPASP